MSNLAIEQVFVELEERHFKIVFHLPSSFVKSYPARLNRSTEGRCRKTSSKRNTLIRVVVSILSLTRPVLSLLLLSFTPEKISSNHPPPPPQRLQIRSMTLRGPQSQRTTLTCFNTHSTLVLTLPCISTPLVCLICFVLV